MVEIMYSLLDIKALPAGHDKHDGRPPISAYVPGPHSSQLLCPYSLKCPGRHATTLLPPGHWKPPGQGVHLDINEDPICEKDIIY